MAKSRFRIPVLSGGLNEIGRPDLINDNELTQCLNMVLNRDFSFSKITDADNWGFNDTNLLDPAALPLSVMIGKIHRFWAWKPRFFPDNCGDERDYLVLIYSTDKQLYLLGYHDTNNIWFNLIGESEPVFDEDELANPPVITETDLGLAMVDGRDGYPAKYIKINALGEVIYGNIGEDSPLDLVSVSAELSNNTFVDSDSADSGMGIPKGSILFVCYTTVTEEGVESNPSPITVFSDLNNIALDTSFEFSKIWQKALLSNLKGFGKYFNIYMASVPYSEGFLPKSSLVLTARVPIKDEAGANSYDASSAFTGKELSYGNSQLVKGDDIAFTGGLLFISNANVKTNFPFSFRYNSQINVTNANNRNYVDAAIWIRIRNEDILDKDEGELIAWSTFDFETERYHLRIFDEDLTTMLPVIYKSGVDYVDILVKIPYLAALQTRTLYFCYGGIGVDEIYRTAEYGRWIEIINEYSEQKVLSPQRVRDSNYVIVQDYKNIAYGNHGKIVTNRAIEDVRIDIDAGFADQSSLLYLDAFTWQSQPFRIKLLDESKQFAATVGTGVVVEMTSYAAIRSDNINIALPENISAGFEIRSYIIPTALSGWSRLFKLGTQANNRYLELEGRNNGGTELAFRLKFRNAGSEPTYSNSLLIDAGEGYIGFKIFISMDRATTNSRKLFLNIIAYNGSLNTEYNEEMEQNFGNTTMFPTGNYYFYRIDGSAPLTFARMIVINMFLIKDTYINDTDKINNIFSLQPYFPEQWIGWYESENKNIAFDKAIEIDYDSPEGILRWSDGGGTTLPVLNYLYAKGKISRIIPAPSYLQGGQTLQNCIMIFGDDFRQRMVIAGTPGDWQAQVNEILVDEKVHFGLSERSRETLLMISNALYWLSGNKLIREDGNGMEILNYAGGLEKVKLEYPSESQKYSAFYNAVDNQLVLYQAEYDGGGGAGDQGEGTPDDPKVIWDWKTEGVDALTLEMNKGTGVMKMVITPSENLKIYSDGNAFIYFEGDSVETLTELTLYADQQYSVYIKNAAAGVDGEVEIPTEKIEYFALYSMADYTIGVDIGLGDIASLVDLEAVTIDVASGVCSIDGSIDELKHLKSISLQGVINLSLGVLPFGATLEEVTILPGATHGLSNANMDTLLGQLESATWAEGSSRLNIGGENSSYTDHQDQYDILDTLDALGVIITINNPLTCADVSFTPGGGTTTGDTDVDLDTVTVGAGVYYTIKDTDEDEIIDDDSALETVTVTLAEEAGTTKNYHIAAIARKKWYNDSTLREDDFEIEETP